jgi:hypothetical protein
VATGSLLCIVTMRFVGTYTSSRLHLLRHLLQGACWSWLPIGIITPPEPLAAQVAAESYLTIEAGELLRLARLRRARGIRQDGRWRLHLQFSGF